MQNYHTHKSFSNCFTPFKDSAMQYEDYAKRAVELNQQVITSVDHGFQGNWMRCYQTAKKYDLMFVFGAEAYFVRDRIVCETINAKGKSVTEADGTNGHIILLARNYEGILQINRVLSEAMRTGFYKVPRVDMQLLKMLSPENVMITTACVAFWGKIDKATQDVMWHYGNTIDETVVELYEHFGASLYLEVQNHNTLWQKTVNQHILNLHYRYGIPIICGLDSHYIYPYQKEERKWLREESGVHMDDEDHEFSDQVYEDYPDEDTVRERFKAQGVLNEDEIEQAISNTDDLIFFDEITLDTSRKLPTIYPNLTQQERNELYLRKIDEAWAIARQSIPESEWGAYRESFMRDEAQMVVDNNMSDYFLLDHEMVKLGKSKGGLITPSGRGSSGSWYTNSLLGMSTLDRFSLPVSLYPARFCTAERLKTSCPD